MSSPGKTIQPGTQHPQHAQTVVKPIVGINSITAKVNQLEGSINTINELKTQVQTLNNTVQQHVSTINQLNIDLNTMKDQLHQILNN